MLIQSWKISKNLIIEKFIKEIFWCQISLFSFGFLKSSIILVYKGCTDISNYVKRIIFFCF